MNIVFLINICNAKSNLPSCNSKHSLLYLQERSHYENLGHLGKLGEDGKIGHHRVIDLTRPEDFEGKCF